MCARIIMTPGLEVKSHSMFHMFLTLFLKALEAIKFNEPICYRIEVQHNQFPQCHIVQKACQNPCDWIDFFFFFFNMVLFRCVGFLPFVAVIWTSLSSMSLLVFIFKHSALWTLPNKGLLLKINASNQIKLSPPLGCLDEQHLVQWLYILYIRLCGKLLI